MTEDTTTPTSGNVRVVLRVRPMLAYETERRCQPVVEKVFTSTDPEQSDELVQIVEHDTLRGAKKKRLFELDCVLPSKETQADVYVKSGAQKAITQDLFQGYNCCILAYGQSGSGKTFTMMGAENPSSFTYSLGGGSLKNDEAAQYGVVPRASIDLFANIPTHCHEAKASVSLTYLEVYGDEIRDLLVEPDTSSSPIKKKNEKEELKIRQDSETKEVYVENLTSCVVHTPQQVAKLMEQANGRRVVASTALNQVSSRSHAICVLTLQGELSETQQFRSKLTFVDLAGSERLTKSEASGQQQKEGIDINKGLFVLGQVIASLTDKKGEERLPPFRESKLTRLLQDSLAGNSQTIMIACVSPADYHADESINTLRYATRARNITNPLHANIIAPESQRMIVLEEENSLLQSENRLLKERLEAYQEQINQITQELTTVDTEYKQTIQQMQQQKYPISPSASVIKRMSSSNNYLNDPIFDGVDEELSLEQEEFSASSSTQFQSPGRRKIPDSAKKILSSTPSNMSIGSLATTPRQDPMDTTELNQSLQFYFEDSSLLPQQKDLDEETSLLLQEQQSLVWEEEQLLLEDVLSVETTKQQGVTQVPLAHLVGQQQQEDEVLGPPSPQRVTKDLFGSSSPSEVMADAQHVALVDSQDQKSLQQNSTSATVDTRDNFSVVTGNSMATSSQPEKHHLDPVLTGISKKKKKTGSLSSLSGYISEKFKLFSSLNCLSKSKDQVQVEQRQEQEA